MADFNYLNDLNAAQKAAVQNIEGPMMIVAGAGSGKTRVLTYRIAHLIKNGVDPFNILALTFTNKAARSMNERITNILADKEGKNLWMGTFHSVFARILRIEAEKTVYPRNFSIYDTSDTKNLIKSILKTLNLNDKTYKPNVVYNRISKAKNELINALAYGKHAELTTEDRQAGKPHMSTIYKHYSSRLLSAGAMDFDDLLINTFELFNKFTDVLYKYQQRFHYILVDEFQDTNFAQYSIIKQLAALRQNICVVGDDAQSIYAFRGANIQNILNFEKDFSDLKTFKLEQNYRSTKNIVEAANSIIKNNKYQLKKQVWTHNNQGLPITLHKTITDNEEGVFVAQTIASESLSKQIPHKGFAVLYRTNAQSRPVEEALRRMDIPYRIYGGLSFYQRKSVKDMLAYFRLVVNANDEEALKRIVNYPARGIGKTTMEKIALAAAQNNTSLMNIMTNLSQFQIDINSGISNKIKQFTQLISNFSSLVHKKNAYDLAFMIAESSGLVRELYNDKTPEGVTHYENVQELLNGIKEFADRNADNLEEATLPKFIEDVALLTDADEEKDKNDNHVSLMTVHSAKGLEFPIVFIVGMEEELFPSGFALNSRNELEEERRLFYVALTRAEQKLYVSFTQSRYRWGNIIQNDPSRFISEIDANFVEGVHLIKNKMPTFNANAAPTKSANKYRIPHHAGLRKISQTSTHTKNHVAIPVGKYKSGMRIKHSSFGIGKIVEISGQNHNVMATIAFDKSGEKKLLLKFAKLEIL